MPINDIMKSKLFKDVSLFVKDLYQRIAKIGEQGEKKRLREIVNFDTIHNIHKFVKTSYKVVSSDHISAGDGEMLSDRDTYNVQDNNRYYNKPKFHMVTNVDFLASNTLFINDYPRNNFMRRSFFLPLQTEDCSAPYEDDQIVPETPGKSLKSLFKQSGASFRGDPET